MIPVVVEGPGLFQHSELEHIPKSSLYQQGIKGFLEYNSIGGLHGVCDIRVCCKSLGEDNMKYNQATTNHVLLMGSGFIYAMRFRPFLILNLEACKTNSMFA